MSIAQHCGDQLLLTLGQLARVDILSALGHNRTAALTLGELALAIQSSPPSVRGEYHRVLACASLREGRHADAERHAQRSIQTFTVTGNRFGVENVKRSLERVRAGVDAKPFESSPLTEPSTTLQAVAEVLAYSADGRIEAAEITQILSAANAVETIATTDLTQPDTWFTTQPIDDAAVSTVRLDERIQLTLEVRADIASFATVNSAKALITAVRDLRAARAAAERAAAVWPAEADADADLNAVIVGHMDEQVSVIRKVARTNVLVLLLGASGTGKEILARGVHAYSPRADKPFLPVNCAAVPGHLLESTLFGYKRGAFTGADADNPGLIRAAAGGTLFLDEIGELGLELQPKLLRFLESGEIAPLGELTTTKVDVRIVCATNQNLAEL
ncbi:MAG TPA: sigma-54 factor interaction domain-containing protein, partial [Candidatus Cybelea sp.]|nr:sigma-54 factor interaction domain-containing protein [Candidatus Cybelea sp.]